MTENQLDTTVHVTGIEISDLHYSRAAGHHLASVSMTMIRTDTPAHIQLLCQANQPEKCADEIVMQNLIDDALRQARRMPGFRRGERQIRVDVSTASVDRRTSPA